MEQSLEMTSAVPAPAQRRAAGMNGRTILRWVVSVLIFLWLVMPMVPLFIWSFTFRWTFPFPLPQAWSMRAWDYLASPVSQVRESFFTSIIVASVVTFISILIGIPAGRALGLYRFRGKRLVEFLIIAPTIVPGLAVVMGIHVIFIRAQLADTMHGVMLAHLIPTTPYMVLVMAGVFSNYNPEFEEQARSLGANGLKTFWYVTLPAIFPGIVVGGLFAFLISWSQYALTLLIGGGAVVTLPIQLFVFASSGDNAITGALSIVFLLPALVILVLTSKFLTGKNAAVGGFGRL